MSLLPGTSEHALLSELVSAVCQQPSSQVEQAEELAARVLSAAPRLDLAAEALAKQHGAAGLARSGVRSCLERLAGLAGQLQAALQLGGGIACGAAFRLLAACRLAATCVCAAAPPSDQAAPPNQPIEAGMQLLLGPGRSALQACAAAGGAGRGAAGAWPLGMQRSMLEVQACLMSLLVRLVGSGPSRGRAARVQQLAPPRRLLDWLEVAAAAEHALRAGPGHAALGSLCCTAAFACNPEIFTAHARHLGSRPQLQDSLARMLLASLQRQAVAAQLPPERRPANLWADATYAVQALCGPGLRAGLDRLLSQAPAGTRGAGSPSGCAWLALSSAAALAAALPCGCPLEIAHGEFMCVWGASAALVAQASVAWCDQQLARLQALQRAQHRQRAQQQHAQQQQRQQACDPQVSQLASSLAKVVDALPAQLALAQRELPGSPQLARAVESLGSFVTIFPNTARIVSLLGVLALHPDAADEDQAPSPGSIIETMSCQPTAIPSVAAVPAWCDTACAMLRAVAAVDGVTAEVQRQRLAAHADLAGGAADLAQFLVRSANVISSGCNHVVRSSEPGALASAEGRASGEAAAQALWRLSSAWCRLAHWVQAAGGAPLGLHKCRAIIMRGPSNSFDAATSLDGLLQPADGARTRRLQALKAAHLEAAASLLGQQRGLAGQAPDIDDCRNRVLESMVCLADCSPASLLANQPLQRSLECLLAGISQHAGEEAKGSRPATFWLARVLTATSEPVLVAWLVNRGVLDALLNGMAENAGGKDAAASGLRAVSSALAALGMPPHEPLETAIQRAEQVQQAELADAAGAGGQQGSDLAIVGGGVINGFQQELVPAAHRQAIAVLEQRWTAEQAAEARLALARIAAARSCANLRCPNLALEGGPAAGQGVGSKRCGGCRVAWYCGTACSHADWKAGHRRVCKLLAAEREQGRQAADEGQEEQQ